MAAEFLRYQSGGGRTDVPRYMSGRRENLLVTLLFLIVIALPLASNLTGRDGADAQAENRDLAAVPAFDGSFRSLIAWPNGFSAWFEDHFGFRARLVRWYGESRLFGLHVSPSAAVVDGPNGWLFYGDDGGMDDYANEKALTEDEVRVWRAAIVRAHDWLASRAIAYVFTIAPDKHVIYPEEVPASIRRIGARSRTDQVFGALSGSGVAAVDLRPALVAARARERIYFLTDTHWNDRGAFVAYRQIIGAVRRQVPAVPPAWRRADFQSTERTIEGLDLAGMIGLTRVLHETDLTLTPIRPRLAKVVEPKGAEPAAEEGYLVTEIPGSTLPRAVIFRDSFTSRLVPYLSEHFSRAVYLWQNDFDADVVSREHPDVVIQEIVGRHLYGFLPSPELVPQ